MAGWVSSLLFRRIKFLQVARHKLCAPSEKEVQETMTKQNPSEALAKSKRKVSKYLYIIHSWLIPIR